MLWKIAFRNLWRHRSKSLVVGSILFLGSVVMTMGSATLTKMDASIKEGMVNRFMGDITVLSSTLENDEVLFQLFNKPVVLAEYEKIESVIKETANVKQYLPYANNFFLILTSHDNPLNQPNGIYVIGADLYQYQRMFGNMEMHEGIHAVKEGERGIYLSEYIRELYYQFYERVYSPAGFDLNPDVLPEVIRTLDESAIVREDDLVIMGASDQTSTLDVRVPIKGVFRYGMLHHFWKEVCILDIETYRECMNYTTGENVSAELTEAQSSLLEISENAFEAFFEEGDTIVEEQQSANLDVASLFSAKDRASIDIDVDQGAYELVAISLKDPIQSTETIDVLNAQFKREGIAARAVSWDAAAKTIAYFVYAIKLALYIVVGLVFLVASIIIMNSLSMAILERSDEIGMMRAIGTQRSFVVRMVGAETLCLTVLFGGMGILFGVLLTRVIGLLKISSQNEFIQMVMGGEFYQPVLDPLDIGIGIVFLSLVSGLSMLYPAKVAWGITPLEAVSRT